MGWWSHTQVNLAAAAFMIGPLALYFGFLGLVNIRRRPTVVSGRLDFLLVIVAFLPLLIQPMYLIFAFGNWVWLGSLILVVAVILWMLLPREFTSWVIYSVTAADVARSLEHILWQMRVPFTRRENRIVCEGHGTLLISNMPLLRNVTVYLEGNRDAQFFRSLGRQMQEDMGKVESRPSLSGHCFLAISVTLLLTPLILAIAETPVVAIIRRWLNAG